MRVLQQNGRDISECRLRREANPVSATAPVFYRQALTTSKSVCLVPILVLCPAVFLILHSQACERPHFQQRSSRHPAPTSPRQISSQSLRPRSFVKSRDGQ